MSRLYSNNFSTTLNGAITNVATSMTLTSVTDFPAVGGGDTAQITITDGTNTEVVQATAIAGSVVTIVRGQEGTSGTTFADLDSVSLNETALSFTDALGADITPQLQGPLDLNSQYVSFGGSSTSTAYNINSTGGVPVLQGPANYRYTFSGSKLYMQAGTSFNSITFANDSTRLVIKTNNLERLQVDDTGVNVSNGTLVVNSNNVWAGGISFDSGTNVLTEYEEGSWTPVLIGLTTTGTNTYSSQTGNYVRIGSTCLIELKIQLDGTAGALDSTGNLQISGLPFTGASANATGPIFFSGVTLPTNTTGVMARLETTALSLSYSNLSTSLNFSDIRATDSLQVRATIVYRI